MAPGTRTAYDPPADEQAPPNLRGIFDGPDGEQAKVAGVVIGTALFAAAILIARAQQTQDDSPSDGYIAGVLDEAERWAIALVKRFSGG